MDKTLIIFIKNPLLGKVKRRLAASIGDRRALSVYFDLLEKTRIETQKVRARRVLYYSAFINTSDKWSDTYFDKKLQIGADLGERMLQAFETVGEGPTIIIGSDCYDISETIIEEAFSALLKHDLVLGPANDGGYYLLGTKRKQAALFEHIDWSTEKVFQQTLEAADRENLSRHILKELVDLDTFSDINQSSYSLK